MRFERRSTAGRIAPEGSARDDGGRSETSSQRARRKFTAGALEQAAQILGATAASVLVVGLVGPYIAALAGSSHIPPAVLGSVVSVVLLIALAAAGGAVVLRGLSRRTNDDGRFGGGPAAPSNP